MRLLMHQMVRIRLRQILGITVLWTGIGALDALNTHALSHSNVLHPTAAYSFGRFLLFHTLGSFSAGLISGSILVFFLREYFRGRSFGFALIVNSFVVSGFNWGISALGYHLFLSFRTGKSAFDPKVLEELAVVSENAYYIRSLVFWFIVVFFTIILLHVNEKYGPGVLFQFLLGRYHRPREEERIFMFADIRSSTTIAERLGHIRFFGLLNDFFKDITNPIILYSGEIYQYVGDQVVVSWTMEKGTKNANCIRCYYGMQEVIRKQSGRYLERYGLIPEFKAGLHCGSVTTGEIGVIKKDLVFSGDVLNTTARIQDTCNKFRVKILLSKYLLDKLQVPPHSYTPRRIGVIELKGKSQKLELFSFDETGETELTRPENLLEN